MNNSNSCRKLSPIKVTTAAKKQHNDIEKKRKDLISVGIKKLNEILPNSDAKEVKNKTLEKAYNFIRELQETNKRLILGNVPEQQGKTDNLLIEQEWNEPNQI